MKLYYKLLLNLYLENYLTIITLFSIAISLFTTNSKSDAEAVSYETLKEICNELDMDIILWTDDKDSKDWELIPESEIINNVTKKVSNGDIFLFHDGNEKFKNTLSAIDVIIPQLQKKGYKWVTVSTLINTK